MTAKKINLLLITHYFPPRQSVATQRCQAFAKYLDPSLFNIHVITTTETAANTLDVRMEQAGIKIHRVEATHGLQPFRFDGGEVWLTHKMKALGNRILYSLALDPFAGFTKNAIRMASEIIKSEKIDVVLASYGPLSSLLVGLSLKIKFPKLFLICDFRDEIQGFGLNLRKIEKQILNRSDLVLSVSEPILTDLKSKSDGKRQYLEINNGFDFPEIREASEDRSRIRFCYTGSFYGRSSPEHFFSALTNLKDRGLLPDFAVDIYGTGKFSVPSSLKNHVHVSPPVPYVEIPKILAASSVLVLVLPAGKRKGVYSGKLFDYLAVNRPILALVDPKDVAAELIRTTRAGYIAHSETQSEIEAAILNLVSDWKANKQMERNWQLITKYSRKNQVKVLEQEILSKLSAP